MFIHTLNTWIIYILLPVVIPTFSLGAPLGEEGNVIKEQTMYDAVAKKCPNLQTTDLNDLKENEIFTKKCLNWADINTTSSFSVETKSNVECLVLYDTLVSFCTDMGDTLHGVKGLIPTTSMLKSFKYTMDTVCAAEHNLYILNKTEHNINSLIRNNGECILLCIDYSEGHVSDICKFAHYFATFNVKKFIEDLNTKVVHESPNISDSKLNKPGHVQESVKSSLKTLGSAADDTKQAQKEPSKPVLVEVPNNKIASTAPKLQNLEDVNQDKDLGLANNPKQESKPEVKPVIMSTDVKIPKPPLQEPQQQNNPPVVPSDEEQLLKHQAKANTKAEKSPPKEPEKDQKPDIQEKPQQDVEPHPDYNIDDKSQGANVDGADQDVLEEEEGEIGQENGDVKPMPVLPEENNDPKTPSKKVKPSTVEDEAVNSFNTPEDSMDGDSYFFSYFTVIMCLFIVGYVGYHNRQKVLALILEGKKGRKAGRGRRPNSANYHKLDTNLEEAISSSCTKTASNVIY